MRLKTHATTSLALALYTGGVCAKTISEMRPELVGSAIFAVSVGATIFSTFAAGMAPDYDLEESDLCECDGNYGMIWEQNLDHRGIVHTLIGAVGYSGLLFGSFYLLLSLLTPFNLVWLVALMGGTFTGYIWHMIADSFTTKGIMWFYPITRIRIRIPLVQNPLTEKIFEIIAVLGFLYLAVETWSTI